MSDSATLRLLGALSGKVAALEALERPYSRIGARVSNNANLTISNITFTALTFNTERYDTAGLHSTSVNTSRLTAPVPGVYLIAAQVVWDTGTTGQRYLDLLLNGATRIAAVDAGVSVSAGLYPAMAISTVYRLAAGDYVEARVYQGSGGSLAVLVDGAYSPEFMMHLLG